MILLRKLAVAAALVLLAAAQAHAADKLTVLLDWFVNPDHAPLVIAREKGFFKAEGLDVDLIAPSDPSAGPRMVAAKQADIAVYYQPNLYMDVEGGLPLVRFGTLVAAPLDTLIVMKDGPIHSVADLKGKKVGYSVTGFQDAVLAGMLKVAGLTINDVKLVNINFSITPPLISGQVDATIGGYRNFELIQMKLEGHEGRAIFPEENGVPPYDELIFVARKDRIGDKRLPRFLEAVEKATLWMTNHPEEGWATFTKAYPNLNDKLNRTAYFATIPFFAKRPFALDHHRYAEFADFMEKHGLIKPGHPVSDFAVELK